MRKKEILDSGYRHNAGPNMKGFYRILILWFVLLALCIVWVHMDHIKADQKELFFSKYLTNPTDEEINQKRWALANNRERLTDTDCDEIDAEMEAYLADRATQEERDARNRELDEHGAASDMAVNHQR